MLRTIFTMGTLAGLLTFGSFGCTSQPPAPPPTAGGHEEHNHEHAHGSHGPHQGQIIELGNEEYHAELVHDEQADKVIIYLLGADAKTSQPIADTELKLNFSVDGEAKQFSLSAAPLDGEPQGQSSRFESSEESLHEVIDNAKAKGRLNVTINGKPYVGTIEGHHHDHAGEGTK